MRQMSPRSTIRVIERNPEGATYGFGVAIQDRASAKLMTYNSALFQKVLGALHRFKGQDITLGNQLVQIDRTDISGAGAIERRTLLKILRDHAQGLGVAIEYETELAADQDLSEYDLVVASDGANSVIRDRFAEAFGTRKSTLGNRFAWYGTHATFDAPGLVFRKKGDWVLAAHFYQHNADTSSFVGECDAYSWVRYGFGKLTDAERREVFEEVFAPELQGQKLIENRSIWRAWPTCTNDHWWHDKYVLIGDARQAAHPTIGSGTRLAFDDAQALVEALEDDSKPLSARLQDYETTRRETAEKLISAMVASYEWYENMREHMKLHPLDFAHSYMTRTGRIDNQMLGFALPEFMGRYLAHSQENA
jgi:2-polyprenyl-6-methoxyphenol hydroxylase-like FAD-dependent oxidoreductase